jgi:6-phosphogluconolactonase (cycloisomerase 2 family)
MGSQSRLPRSYSYAAALCVMLVGVTACGGSDSGGGGASTYTVGGSVSGLKGSGLELGVTGGGTASVAASATTFTFSPAIAAGTAYSVTVVQQPSSPAQTCTVANGSGMLNSNVTNVSVTCTTATFSVGGSIAGLTASGLTLQDNGGDTLTVAAAAKTFQFATAVASGSAYAVTVKTQPTGQTCTVAQGSGTVGSAAVSSVTVSCVTAGQTIGGTITGLTKSGLVLQDNGGANLTVAANATSFTFPTPLTTGAAYHVTVLTQPTTQTCTVTNGSGTVGSSKVTSVAITCVTGFSVGGTVSGLTSSGLTLTDNGGDTLTVPAKATTFIFATGLTTGAAYHVAISAQPSSPAQVCSLANASGTIAGANVSNVAVSCVSVGQYVYIANGTDNTNADGDVPAFSINQTTGALTALAGSPFLAGNLPTSVAIDRTDKLMYVANKHSTNVSGFSIGAGGIPTLVATYGSSGTSGQTLALTPNNEGLYVGGFGTSTGSVYGYTVDTATGALTSVGSNNPANSGNTPYGIAVDPSNSFVFATSTFQHYVWVYAIGTGGVLTNLLNSPFPTTGAGPYEIAVSPLGTENGGFVYTADSTTNQIDGFSYDTTGNLTALTGSPYSAGATQPEGIIIDPTGQYLFVTNFADNSVATFTLAPSTGIATLQGSPAPSGVGPTDLKLDPSGQFLYVVNQTDGTVTAYKVSAGALTVVGTYPLPSGAAPNGVAVY